MQYFPEEQSSSDAQAWLCDGWLVLPNGMPARYYDNTDERVQCFDYSDSMEGDRVDVDFDEVRVHWPRLGAVNMTGFAVFVARRAERQWGQTYRARCCTLTVPGKWQVMRELGVEVAKGLNPDHYDVVRELFDPTYPSMPQALDALNSKERVSVAINPHVILIRMSDAIHVYHRTELVAEIVNGSLRSIGNGNKVSRLTKHFGGMFT